MQNVCTQVTGIGINFYIVFYSSVTMLPFYTEVYAAREKNGVYIPKERYIQEESERKVFHYFPLILLFSP